MSPTCSWLESFTALSMIRSPGFSVGYIESVCMENTRKPSTVGTPLPDVDT